MDKTGSINADLVSKFIGMMFSDNENERNTAAAMFVKTFKNAQIHPSDIKLFVFGNSETFLGEVLEENNDLSCQLEDALSDIEANLNEIEKLREEISLLKTGKVNNVVELSDHITTEFELFKQLVCELLPIKHGWKTKIAEILSESGKPVFPAYICNWQSGKAKIPVWVFDYLKEIINPRKTGTH